MLRAGCDLVSGSAADLTGHFPDPAPRTPAGNTRDHMALLPTSTFSTLWSLTLSHRHSRIQLFTQDGTPDATKLGKRLTPSSTGSFLLVRMCLGQCLPPHRTLACLQSSSQVSYLDTFFPGIRFPKRAGIFLPWQGALASSIHGSVLSLFIP